MPGFFAYSPPAPPPGISPLVCGSVDRPSVRPPSGCLGNKTTPPYDAAKIGTLFWVQAMAWVSPTYAIFGVEQFLLVPRGVDAQSIENAILFAGDEFSKKFDFFSKIERPSISTF